MKKKNTKCTKIKKFLCKTALVIGAVCAVSTAVLKVLDFLKNKKAMQDNNGREFKEFFNFMGSKKISLSDETISGVITKNLFAATSFDLSGATFKEDGFISLNSKFSAINIIVPSNVNVKVDGLIKSSSVNNEVPEDNTLPTLYIASKLKCTALRISRQD